MRMRRSMTHERRTKSHFPSLSKRVLCIAISLSHKQRPRQVIREFGRLDKTSLPVYR